ncbi:hypothetical protein JCM16303_000304 [Sporobolomyces ruberrimus]
MAHGSTTLVRLFLVTAFSLSLSLQTARAAFARGPFPHPLIGHHSSFVDTGAVALGRRTPRLAKAPFYSLLVAFGASYTDNAHPRLAKWNNTFRDYYPYSKFDSKYTNGKIAVEYMIESGLSPALKHQKGGGVALQDYAYGGSVIENGLGGTNANAPSIVDQVSMYRSDLKTHRLEGAPGRVLHYFNSGINPVQQIWYNAMAQNFTKRAKATAVSSLSANVKSYAASIESIAKDKLVKSNFFELDFLLVGIPHLEIVPSLAHQVLKSTSEADALAFIKQLSCQYNDEVQALAVTIKKKFRHSRVFFYDMAKLWYSIYGSPSAYNLSVSPITTPCYNSTLGALCQNPNSYLYFDTLHPTTAVHKIIAEEMNALVLGKSSG